MNKLPKIILLFLIVLTLNNLKSHASKTMLGNSDFNAVDATAAIQYALSSTVDTVIIKNVGQPWIVQPITIKDDGLTLILEPGVVLKAKAGAFPEGKSLLNITDRHFHRVKNIIVIGYGATVEMIKSEYTTNENRHCIFIQWAESIKVFGLTLKDSGGDGILVQRSYYGDPCINVHIKDCVSDNNRRQGISVISAVDLLIENCVFKNTNGTNPMAGIDIEPDARTSELVNQVLKNILIKNCRFVQNERSGIEIALHQPNALKEPVSIRFENCYVTGTRGINIFTSADVKGNIEFHKCLIENISEVGIALHNPAYGGISQPLGSNPKLSLLRFSECVFRNLATNYDKPIELEGRKWNDASTDIPEYGGVEFVDCLLEDNKNREFLLAVDGYANSLGVANIKGNITVINPNGARTILGAKAHDIDLKITEIKTAVNVAASIVASEPNASELNLDAGTFTISRTTNFTAIPYAINYTLSGTATPQQDYSLMNGFTVISPNQTSATAHADPISDNFPEFMETVVATLVEDTRPNVVKASYTIGNPSKATVNIDEGLTSNEKYLEANRQLLLHPNPAKTELFIKDKNLEIPTYEITSIEGKILQTGIVSGEKINIETLQTGAYILKVTTDTGKRVQRFVKE